MRLTALVFAALMGSLAACEDAGGTVLHGPLTPPIDIATGPGPAGLRVCQSLVRAMDSLERCAPTPRDRAVTAWMQRDLRSKVTATEGDTAGWAETCLDLLVGFVADYERVPCRFGLSATERAWVDGYARPRAFVPDSVTGLDRARLVELAHLRDRACGCLTTACRDAIEAALDAPPRLGRLDDRVVAEIGGAILEDITRCGRRVPRVETPAEVGREAVAPPTAPPAPPPTTPPPAPRPTDPSTVTLPNGERVTRVTCEAIADEFERENCRGLFIDVGDCRRHRATAEAAACERRVLAEYAEATAPATPTDFDDDAPAD